MTKQDRTNRLRAIMADHKLSAADVGRVLNRKPQTVRSWACANDERVIPENALLLLELKCQR